MFDRMTKVSRESFAWCGSRRRLLLGGTGETGGEGKGLPLGNCRVKGDCAVDDVLCRVVKALVVRAGMVA